MIYLQLFYNFFITGLFSIGGGLATPPFSLRSVGPRPAGSPMQNWPTCWPYRNPPGHRAPIWRLMGFETASLPGAIATLGLIAPGIITSFSSCQNPGKIQRSRYVQWGLLQSQGGVYRLIAAAGLLGSADLPHTLQIAGTKRVSALDIFDIKGIASRSRNPDRNPDMEKTSSRHLILIAAARGIPSFISPASDPYETVRLSAAPRMSERFRCVFHKTRQ